MEKTNQIKGRNKAALGVQTDDERLKRAEKFDQVVGTVKVAAAKAMEKVKEA